MIAWPQKEGPALAAGQQGGKEEMQRRNFTAPAADWYAAVSAQIDRALAVIERLERELGIVGEVRS